MSDRKFAENEHVWVEERLSAYIDNQLTPLEQAQLERHLRGCARCQASLASLRWTVSLVKQAPAPALPRMFTLPVPNQTRRAASFGFGFARLATVVATLLLFAVIGLDAISQLGGGFVGSAPAPAALQNAANPTSVALAPSQTQDQAKEATPTSSPVRLSAAPQPTSAPAPTGPVQPPALPPAPAILPSPTEVLGLGGGGPETVETAPTPSAKAAGSPAPLPRAPAVAPGGPMTTTLAAGAASLATPVPPTSTPQATATTRLPAATATVPSPTVLAKASPTPNVQAFAQPTLASLPPSVAETPRQIASPVRAAEVGLFFLAVFFAAVTVLLRRRK
jgi:hypothetical protein